MSTGTIGFLGFGEAAFALASGLRDAGWVGRMVAYVRKTNPVWSSARSAMREKAEQVNVELVPDAASVAQVADVVFSANSPAAALSVAVEVASDLKLGCLYIDINSTSPLTKQEVARQIARGAGMFVDVAIMGPLPVTRHRTPMLASGPGARGFVEMFTPFGVRCRVVGDEPGQAAAIKVLQSILMKGMAALLYETLEASNKLGATEILLESLYEMMLEVPFPLLVRRLVVGTAVHARRRVHEMNEVLQMLSYLDCCAIMTRATRDMHQRLVDLGLPDKYRYGIAEDVGITEVVRDLASCL